MRLFIVPILLIAFLKSTTPKSYENYYDDYITAIETESSVEAPPPEPRILGSLFKGWKGDDDHPFTEFGKIHVIKKGWGDGHHGVQHHGHGHGHGHGGQGWGWGTYGNGWGGPGYTAVHHTSGWKAPSKKKSWFPKKSFGIHVKGGVGFSFGGKKGDDHKGQTVVVQHSPGWGGWGGWNSGHHGHGHGHNNYGWGGWGGDHDNFDYYDDDAGKKEDDSNDEVNDESDDRSDDRSDRRDDRSDDRSDDRRRMDLGDYLYEY